MYLKKRTKIVATIADNRCEVDFIRDLYEHGMNVARLNTAHIDINAAKKVVDNIRKVSKRIAILIDTKGPEMRLTSMDGEGGFEVKTGQKIKVSGSKDAKSTKDHLYINYENVVADVDKDALILIDDGEIELHVTNKDKDTLFCEVTNPGVIKGRKSVNIPEAPIKLPSLSQKDIGFIEWAIDYDIDFIAHSFVRTAKDIEGIQEMLDAKDSKIKIIAKIENQEGVDNIDGILAKAYGIMVARGDLGVEIPAERIPIIQRMLLRKCRERKKPVIIATQMLHTMIENPRPTRAEVSDVANAIYQRTDAVMLSGETAYGDYPVEAIKTMSKIAVEIERNLHADINIKLVHVTRQVVAILAHAAVEITENNRVDVDAIVVDTCSGRTGRYISAYRPTVPVFAKCYTEKGMRELALSYGVFPSMMTSRKTKEEFQEIAVQSLVEDGSIKRDTHLVIVAGSFGAPMGATFIEITDANTILGKKAL